MIESKTIRVGRVRLMRHGLPILAALIGFTAAAQTVAPAVGATMAVTAASGASAASAAPSEALQRQASGPYRMILRSAAIQSKPRVAPAPTLVASPAATGAAARRNAAKPTAETDQPTSPTTVPQSAQAAVSSIDTPTLRPVEVPTSRAEETPTPIIALAAPTSPPQPPAAPAPLVARTALVLIKNDPPTLSGPLARESPSGIVRVAFKVNPDGSTSDFKIAASNNRRLNNAVVAAVTNWRYQPIDAAQTTEVEMVFSAE